MPPLFTITIASLASEPLLRAVLMKTHWSTSAEPIPAYLLRGVQQKV
jgi:hypothetical protein